MITASIRPGTEKGAALKTPTTHSNAIVSEPLMMPIEAEIKAIVHAHLFAFRSPKPIIGEVSPNPTTQEPNGTQRALCEYEAK